MYVWALNRNVRCHIRSASTDPTVYVLGVQAEWDPLGGFAKQAATAEDAQGTVVFRGARARVGMFHGEVVKVVPHSRTGEHPR
jgi:hypothetical protein